MEKAFFDPSYHDNQTRQRYRSKATGDFRHGSTYLEGRDIRVCIGYTVFLDLLGQTLLFVAGYNSNEICSHTSLCSGV